MATVKARTARTGHLCENCGWKSILPRHRYLLHTGFPSDDYVSSEAPYSVKECVACAIDRDYGADLGPLAACGTYCCGETPCAQPVGHDGDHSCRRDANSLGGQS